MYFCFSTDICYLNFPANFVLLKVCRQRRKTFLFLFCFLLLLKVCRQRRKTFLFLFCFFFLRSADVRRKTFLFLLCFLLLRSADVRRKTFLFLLCFLLFLLFFLIFLYSRFSPTISPLFLNRSRSNLACWWSLMRRTDWIFFQVNRTRGRDRAWSQSFTMLYNRKNSIYCA